MAVFIVLSTFMLFSDFISNYFSTYFDTNKAPNSIKQYWTSYQYRTCYKYLPDDSYFSVFIINVY